MSFNSFTIDQLMQLDPPTLAYALRLFMQQINGTIALLQSEQQAIQDEQTLDELDHLLTLRKVFKHRLEELSEKTGDDVTVHSLSFDAAA
ncbi:MAG: hypothetical protein ACRYFK_16625 [Janthinobacterium lividum]